MTKKKTDAKEEVGLDLEPTTRPEVMADNNYEPPKTFTDAVKYFVDREKKDVTQTLRTAWELGGTIKALMEDGKYGESTVEEFSEKAEISPSWCYECKTLFEVYSWEIIQTRFVETRIRPYALTRIAATKDKVVRAQLENKLVDGTLEVSKIDQERKKIDAEVNPDKGKDNGDDEGSGPVGPKDATSQTVSTSNDIRGVFGDIEQTAKNLEFMLEKVDNALDRIDDMTDETVRDSTLAFVSSSYEQMLSLEKRLHACAAKTKQYII